MIGIYKITNPKGQIYIGSSKDIESRWKKHISYYRKTKIQDSIALYGADTHSLDVLEICSKHELLERERYWQDFYLSYRHYNLNVQKANNLKFNGGKREKANRVKNIYYMDSTNGVFYETAREISDLYLINGNTLRSKLSGHRVNDTIFIKV